MNAGMLSIVVAQFFFSASNVSVKFLNGLNEPVPTLELICIRMAMAYIYSVSYMYWRKIPDPFLGPEGVRVLLVFRGFTGFIALSGMYFSLQYLSLSDAVVLKFIVPTLTGFSGAIFLKEPLTLKEVLTGLCSFSGVLLIARPQFLFGSPQADQVDATPGQRILSVTAGLIGVVGSTGSYTLLRAIGKRAHPLHIIAFFSLGCVVISAMGMIIFKTPPMLPTRALWLVLLFLVGILGLIAQIFLAMGFQRETASRGTLAMYTAILFAVMFEFAIFHTTPTALSIAGAVIIISSAIYISLAKKKAIQSSHNPEPERPQRVTPDSEDDPEAR
ncbi:drug/metabolite transporter superfamily [Lactifluus subvellereus]|nr:drug/metabolite transporter superfamily [Lactifluus subvellereus]